jgi:hypothetical protein
MALFAQSRARLKLFPVTLCLREKKNKQLFPGGILDNSTTSRSYNHLPESKMSESQRMLFSASQRLRGIQKKDSRRDAELAEEEILLKRLLLSVSQRLRGSNKLTFRFFTTYLLPHSPLSVTS